MTKPRVSSSRQASPTSPPPPPPRRSSSCPTRPPWPSRRSSSSSRSSSSASSASSPAASSISGIHVDDDPHHREAAAASPGRRFRESSCGAATARGLDPAAVRQLPVLSYVGGGEKEGCVVCLAYFGGEEKVKLIPGCGHMFHPQCIDAWLMSKGSCPICRCSDLFGSVVGRGAVRLDFVVGDGGEEFGVDVEVEAGRGGVEEAARGGGGGQGEKVVELGRSRSSSAGLSVEGERVVFLRRTCSF